MDPLTAISNMVTALCTLLGKMIDGVPPQDKVIMWDNWIKFWQPMIDLMIKAADKSLGA